MSSSPRTPLLERDESNQVRRAGDPVVPAASDSAEDISLFDALNALLRFRSTIVTLTVCVTAAMIAVTAWSATAHPCCA